MGFNLNHKKEILSPFAEYKNTVPKLEKNPSTRCLCSFGVGFRFVRRRGFLWFCVWGCSTSFNRVAGRAPAYTSNYTRRYRKFYSHCQVRPLESPCPASGHSLLRLDFQAPLSACIAVFHVEKEHMRHSSLRATLVLFMCSSRASTVIGGMIRTRIWLISEESTYDEMLMLVMGRTSMMRCSTLLNTLSFFLYGRCR